MILKRGIVVGRYNRESIQRNGSKLGVQELDSKVIDIEIKELAFLLSIKVTDENNLSPIVWKGDPLESRASDNALSQNRI